MSHANEIHQIEMTIDHAKGLIELGQMAERLAQIPEFKKIVMDGYFANEAARLVHLYSDPNIDSEVREHINRDMLGIGAFKRYLSTVVGMGRMAQEELHDAQLTLDEIRNEGDEE